MEDVLEVYTRPYDERRPQVCLDESGKQLVADKLEGLPMRPGQPERSDYSYEQGQMYNLFLACEPLAGKRYVQVTEHRTSQDWAHFLREVVDVHYPNASTFCSYEAIVCAPKWRTVGTGVARGVHALGRSSAAFDLTPGTY